MELKLVKCKPLAGESFRPSDVVSGRLQIKGAVFDKKSTITAVLQGNLILDVTPEPCGPNPGRMTRKFLRIEKKINLDEFDSVDLDKAELTYTYPLQFKLPQVSPCHHCGKPSQLPPSMDISSSRFRFRSEYTLTVSAHRSFLGVLPKSTSVRQILPVTADPPTFVSNPSSLPTPPPSPSSTKLVHLAMSMSDDEMHTQDDYFREREASLPSYSPPPSSISHPRLQVITPGPLTLVREQDILLQLMVHLPQSLSGSGDVFLRSGTISLCQSVKVCMRPTPYHTTQSHMICSWDEPMKIQGETVLLDPSCFGGRLSTPGSVQPSYNSCLLRTESTLEIEVMISRGRQGKVQCLRSRVDVTVASAPPAYGDQMAAFKLQAIGAIN